LSREDQQEQEQLPARVWFVIITAVFLAVVILPIAILQYIALFFWIGTPTITTEVSILDILLALIAIAIGLIIWWHQNQQSKKIEEINSRVKEIVEKAEFREDWRKYYHLFFIRSQVDRVRRLVNKSARSIQRNIIENHTATLKEWQDEREEVRKREAHARRAMDFVSVRFGKIDDLVMDFTLAEDVNIDLGNLARLLTDIRDLDPINQALDKEKLTRLLQELSSDALERLKKQLGRIAHEVPQMEEKERRG
jgi:hypothetical protein